MNDETKLIEINKDYAYLKEHYEAHEKHALDIFMPLFSKGIVKKKIL